MITVIEDNELKSMVTYLSDYLDRRLSNDLLREMESYREAFRSGHRWNGESLVPAPRLAASFGDEPYAYPDMDPCLPWPSHLEGVRSALSESVGHQFNYALANWYRDGRDHAGWHADKVAMHVPGSSIAIVSLGATRVLAFRNSGTSTPCRSISLDHGSLVLMSGSTQLHFEHALLVDAMVEEPRVSVTFRHVIDPSTL